MKRSPMPDRTEPLARSGPLRRTSSLSSTPSGKPRRQRDTGPSTAQRKAVRARSGGLCELALPGCWGQATQACHRLGKKAGGRHGEMGVRINGAAWFLDGCGWCHGLTTSAIEPDLSKYRAAGLLLVEGQDAREVPVLTRHAERPGLLDDAGGWRTAA